MIKFSRPDDFDFGMEHTSLAVDTAQLIKRAYAKEYLKVEKTANQTDVHIIALGALEGTGFNRNGDGFTEADCIKNHHMFKQANRAVHRNHKNKPSDPKFGNIKAAAYNKDMKRIELVVGLDNDLCQNTLHKIASGEEVYWSMACKIAGDFCTKCHHFSKDESSRCSHIPSEIGNITKEGIFVGMMNPNPNWFEISEVPRPADRIGFTLAKVASALYTPRTTQDCFKLYPDFHIPEDEVIISKTAAEKRTLLKKLAELEKRVDAVTEAKPVDAETKFIKEELPKTVPGKLSKETIEELRKIDPPKLFRTLAEAGVIMDPESFAKYLFGDKVSGNDIASMKGETKRIFSTMDDDQCGCSELLNNESFDPSSSSQLPSFVRDIISALSGSHSLFEPQTKNRVIRVTIMGKPKEDTVKESSERTEKGKELAKIYGLYKVSALQYLEGRNKLTNAVLLHSVAQNKFNT